MKKAIICSSLAILFVTITLFFFLIRQVPLEVTTLKRTSFAELPGWKNAQVRTSLQAFQLSCQTFLKQDPEKWMGNEYVKFQVKDWYPACHAANNLKKTASDTEIRLFFQTWFSPMAFYKNKPIQGLFTSYFMPTIKGSLVKTANYTVPLYGVPSNLLIVNLEPFKQPALKKKRIIGRLKNKKIIPFYTREEINHGAIKHTAPVLAWIKDPLDRVFLEIEGSGVIELDNHKHLYIGYAEENGAPYTSIASVLIKEGILTREAASSKNIKAYFHQHPKEIDRVLNQNKSFVFFSELKTHAALGAQGVALTPGYSLAVDPSSIPYGTPTWLSTTLPSPDNQSGTPFNRLMVAQDTGGAIRGTVRGDIFWGAGEKAYWMSNKMQNKGRYWLLLPNEAFQH